MKKTIVALLALAGVSFGAESLKSLDSILDATNALVGGNEIITGSNNTITWDTNAVDGTLTDYTLTFAFTKLPSASTDAFLRLHQNGGHAGLLSSSATTLTICKNYNTLIDGNATPHFTINTTDTFALTRFGDMLYVSNLTTGVYIQQNLTAGNIPDDWNLVSGTARFWTNGGAQNIQAGEVANLSGLTEAQILEVVTSGSYTPSDSVPEPTTATLSLLALAGLAARRRRK